MGANPKTKIKQLNTSSNYPSDNSIPSIPSSSFPQESQQNVFVIKNRFNTKQPVLYHRAFFQKARGVVVQLGNTEGSRAAFLLKRKAASKETGALTCISKNDELVVEKPSNGGSKSAFSGKSVKKADTPKTAMKIPPTPPNFLGKSLIKNPRYAEQSSGKRF